MGLLDSLKKLFGKGEAAPASTPVTPAPASQPVPPAPVNPVPPAAGTT